jgi:hypothetical protein
MEKRRGFPKNDMEKRLEKCKKSTIFALEI